MIDDDDEIAENTDSSSFCVNDKNIWKSWKSFFIPN